MKLWDSILKIRKCSKMPFTSHPVSAYTLWSINVVRIVVSGTSAANSPTVELQLLSQYHLFLLIRRRSVLSNAPMVTWLLPIICVCVFSYVSMCLLSVLQLTRNINCVLFQMTFSALPWRRCVTLTIGSRVKINIKMNLFMDLKFQRVSGLNTVRMIANTMVC